MGSYLSSVTSDETDGSDGDTPGLCGGLIRETPIGEGPGLGPR